ncbi:MAG TPA: homocysteine S-methyltransferase family protein [Armatimonadota bacterium]|nr:homocysteine S-methyltransferase family protein [Armatimonadota bacterium]
MATLLERVQRGDLLMFDGAMGTMLQANGLQAGECPELWNVTHPEVVRGIAEAYFAAGSDVVSTNTFGGNALKLREFGLEGRARELNAAGARLAKDAAGPERCVAASVGPTGQILEDEGGDATEAALYAVYVEQIAALAEGGADAVIVETMLSTLEAAQAVRAGKAAGLPVFATFAFARGARGFRTVMGASPARVAEEMADAGADAVGANCGGGIRDLLDVVREFRAAAPDLPLLIQPNAGLPELVGGITRYTETPADMAARVPDLLAAGATLLGGCCGTTPAHIAAIATVVKG